MIINKSLPQIVARTMSNKKLKSKFLTLCLCAFTIILSDTSAQAQQAAGSNISQIDIIPAKSVQNAPELLENNNNVTHSILNLTPDKSELVRLEKDAASVVIGNPAHVSVLAENSKLLVFIPREPGATYVSVLGQDGNIIMQRHVVVGRAKDNYVRIRRSCAGSDNESCQQTQTFYCPDMCHSISGASEESGAESAVQAGQNSMANGMQDDEPDDVE